MIDAMCVCLDRVQMYVKPKVQIIHVCESNYSFDTHNLLRKVAPSLLTKLLRLRQAHYSSHDALKTGITNYIMHKSHHYVDMTV